MAYEEYDYYNEPSSGSLKESLYNILHGLTNEKNLRETGQSFRSALQLTPNVTESLGRGGVAQAIGTSGDLRDLSNTINSYLPKSVRNFTRAAEFLANPYATAIQQTAPTTEQTLDFVPRVTAPYEGYKQHETLGEYVAPALGYFGVKGLKAVKDLPIGGTIQDVSKVPLTPKEAEILASQVDELGFHSPLENAILGIKQPKGTGDQFLKQLERTPGVKTEELDVTGVKQYLLDHPTVTKQELLDQMATNRLKLENKVLDEAMGGADTYDEYSLRGGDVYHDQDYIDSLAEDLHYDLKTDEVVRNQERQALLEADPELFANNPLKLEDAIDDVLEEQAKQAAHEMYYDNPITHHYDDYGYDIYGNPDNGYSIKDPNGRFLDLGGNRGIYDIDEAQDALRQHLLDEGVIDIGSEGGPKYEDYTLPGNYTNYREVLTTLPQNEIQKFDPSKVEIVRNRQSTTQGTYTIKYNGEEMQTYGDEFNAKDNYKGLSDNEIMQTAKKLYEQGNKFQQIKPRSGAYQSSHFDEPNILAHTRLNDRIINGKKTLMVEEIQSDWHQAGRRKGYSTGGDPYQELNDYQNNLVSRAREAMKENALKDGLSEKEADDLSTSIVRNTDFNGMAKYLGEIDKYTEIAQKARNQDKLVPDAPFKKNWHEMMMKQILNEAVKGDYDAIAFTTGKQQAERYSLSKQISKVNYTEAGVLRAYDKNGNLVISKKLDSPDQIEDYIGKEPAKKLMEQELKSTYIGEKESGEKVAHGNPNMFDARELTGVDLDVGGEGMKGFYDKILPDFVNKYTKKYGMGTKKANLKKVGTADLENIYKQAEKLGYTREQWDAMRIVDRAEILRKNPVPGEEVHFVELTDAAKKDIKSKGQPLFSGIGLAAPPLLMDEEDN